MTQQDNEFGARLRAWRKFRGLSQQNLALDVGLSERHVSFLETGRARPSPQSIERLAQVLDVPMRDRNDLHVSAGFAPAHSDAPSSVPDALYERAIAHMLKKHDPFPAFVFDRWWQLIDANITGRVMAPELKDGPVDMVELMLNPKNNAADMLNNYRDLVAIFFIRLRRDALQHPQDERLAEVLARATRYGEQQGLLANDAAQDIATSITISPQIITPSGDVVETCTLISRFDNVGVLGLDELRVELNYPMTQTGETFFETLYQKGIAN